MQSICLLGQFQECCRSPLWKISEYIGSYLSQWHPCPCRKNFPKTTRCHLISSTETESTWIFLQAVGTWVIYECHVYNDGTMYFFILLFYLHGLLSQKKYIYKLCKKDKLYYEVTVIEQCYGWKALYSIFQSSILEMSHEFKQKFNKLQNHKPIAVLSTKEES